MEQFKKEVEKKIGEQYDVYCIVEDGKKMYASIIAKEGILSPLNYDTPIYVKDNNSIKEEPSSSEIRNILNKGKLIYTHPTLWEDEEDNDVKRESIKTKEKIYAI